MNANLWTREEMILAFNLYLKLPFSKIGSRRKEVIELANLIGRSSSSVAIRLTNYAACDPFHQARGVKGMQAGKKRCQPIWDEFINNREALLFESEKILAELQNITIENKYSKILEDVKDIEGKHKLQMVKTRVNQNVFRQMILANYDGKCALSGVDIPELLVASHIIPWSVNEKERLNPENGICLSSLYDKAFDSGLIGFNADYHVVISKRLIEKEGKDFYKDFFEIIRSKELQPARCMPNREFLEWHMDCVFQK